jgi:hypothetical protein
MSAEDKLQQNIRRSAGFHALKQIAAIVEEENRTDSARAHSLRWLLRYGWILLLAVGALFAHLTGVY